MPFSQMSVAARLYAGFGLILALLAVVTGIAKIFYDSQARKEVSGVVGSYETTRQAITLDATTALNILGLKVADKANLVLMALQFLVIALFIGFAVAHMVSRHGGGSLLSVTPFSGTGGFPAIAAGAAIAAYSFLGFEDRKSVV